MIINVPIMEISHLFNIPSITQIHQISVYQTFFPFAIQIQAMTLMITCNFVGGDEFLIYAENNITVDTTRIGF